MNKKILGLLLSAALALSVLAGCGGDGTSGTTTASPDSEETTGAEESSDDAEESDAAGEGDSSQFINLHLPSNPTMLDPALTSDGQGGILGFIVEALMKVDKDFNLIPGIAESYEVNDDATVFTFHITPDVVFHDGTPCDAEAVAWNLNRQVGDNALPDMPYSDTIFGKVTSVEATDDLTVVVTLSESDSTLPIYLAMPNGTGLVSPTAFEEDPEGFQRNPVGAGPYIFDEWIDDQSVKLTANPNYYDGEVQNAGINFKIIKEDAVRSSEYIAGGIDHLHTIGMNDIEQIESAGYTVKSQPNLGYAFLSFADYENNDIFKDIRVRQAIWHALDRDTIVKALYNDRLEPANSMIPPGMYGGDEEYTTYEYDVEKAKELLAEAGYPDGFEFLYISRNEAEYQSMAVALQMELEKVGITMNIELLQRADWLEKVFQEEKDHDAIQFNWGAASNDPSYMAALWLSANARGGGYNTSGYNNPDFDALIDQARKTGDIDEQIRLYSEAAQMVNDDAPVVFLNRLGSYHSTNDSLVDPEGNIGTFASCPWWQVSKKAA